MTLSAQIEAILFWKGESTSKTKLASILSVTVAQIEAGLVTLEKELDGRGIQLIRKEDEVVLATHKEISGTIEKLIKEEIHRDLGKAGLETLALVLYRGPISRSDIDYIRGVNSQFILRNLLIRGLVEKVTDEKDQRRFLYKPTFDLLTHLGIKSIDELPEWQAVQAEITEATTAKEAVNKESSESAETGESH
ncbi:MAG: segregation and condensation protein segregation and condensation protein [Candidatus Parcubacteria bacterium]|jgi:segregation and condensation protein B